MNEESLKEEMKEEVGTISVQMENIFPIIKKWLYSDKDIFLRELVANGMDAINKFKHLSLIGEAEKDEDSEFKVNIRIDKIDKTITFIDNGIGLTADEVKKYINQVAFSGAEEFINKYKAGNEIIGHFGLGFYSSFMVSQKVEINSLSYQKDAEPIKWSCDGTPEFKLTTGTKKERGTEIILYVSEDEEEFLDENTIKNLVKTYCDFLPYKIEVNGIPQNKQTALWNQQPSSLKKEDYIEFYRYLYPFAPEPMFWVHINVDYPFNLKTILYFPQLTHELDVSKGHIKLFCNNVYVSDNTQELLPRFLTVLQGGIDSPDIPLNVSRSMLQNDPYVRKISSYITKKVADRLKEMFDKEREEYNKAWDGLQAFVKVGCMEDDRFYDLVKDVLVFKTSTDEFETLKEYLEKNTEKTDKKVFYSSDKNAQITYINLFKAQEIDVLVLDSFIDSHFLSFLEYKNNDVRFARIDSDIANNSLDKESKSDLVVDPTNNKTSNQVLEDVFKNNLNKPELKVKVENLKSKDVSAMIIYSEEMRRIQEITNLMQQKDLGLLADYTLVINSNSPIIENLKTITNDTAKEEDVKLICNHVFDLALISQKQLPAEKMGEFLERANKILEIFSKKI